MSELAPDTETTDSGPPSWTHLLAQKFSNSSFDPDTAVFSGRLRSDRATTVLDLSHVPARSTVIVDSANLIAGLSVRAVPLNVDVRVIDVPSGLDISIEDSRGNVSITGSEEMRQAVELNWHPETSDVTPPPIHVRISSDDRVEQLGIVSLYALCCAFTTTRALPRLAARDCILILPEQVGRMTLQGRSDVRGDASIRLLDVAEDLDLWCTNLTIPESLFGDVDTRTRFILHSHKDRKPSELTLGHSESMHVRAVDIATLRLQGVTRDLAVEGPLNLLVEGGIVAGLSCVEPKAQFPPSRIERPLLTASPGSAVVGISGTLSIRSVVDARISGSPPDGFTVDSFATDELDLRTSVSESVSGARIEGIRISQSPSAGQIWQGLASSALLSAATKGTPLEKYAIWRTIPRYWGEVFRIQPGLGWRLPWFGWRIPRPVDVRARIKDHTAGHWSTKAGIAEDTIYAREAAAALQLRGSSGVSRSRATWTSYRLRQYSAVGSERWFLALYRLVGYGERPGPAFATWAILVLMATVQTLRGLTWELSWDGVVTVLEALGFWAVPSFGLINMPELPTGVTSNVGTFLAHSIIAIPFVTAVLALRKLLKIEIPGGN